MDLWVSDVTHIDLAVKVKYQSPEFLTILKERKLVSPTKEYAQAKSRVILAFLDGIK